MSAKTCHANRANTPVQASESSAPIARALPTSTCDAVPLRCFPVEALPSRRQGTSERLSFYPDCKGCATPVQCDGSAKMNTGRGAMFPGRCRVVVNGFHNHFD